jgi:hypothetical protein
MDNDSTPAVLGLSEGLGHGARYAEWRDFYSRRVTGWMRLEELRIECARLQDAGGKPSPELLLVHAMHELERLHAELDKIRHYASNAAQARGMAYAAICGDQGCACIPGPNVRAKPTAEGGSALSE